MINSVKRDRRYTFELTTSNEMKHHKYEIAAIKTSATFLSSSWVYKLEYSRIFDFIPDIIWKASFGAFTLCSLTLSSASHEALTNEEEPGSVFA